MGDELGFRRDPFQPFTDFAVWVADQFDAESRAFDARRGIETRWFDLGNYEPTPPSVVDAVLDELPGPVEATTFVDLGSGKGRAVLIAAGCPFREVVGIEMRRGLHRRALHNLAVYRGERRAPVRLVHGDVRDVPLPDGPLVLFLYNPFGEETWASVLDRCERRPVQLVAVNPPSRAWLERRGFVRMHHVEHPSRDRCWSRYARV